MTLAMEKCVAQCHKTLNDKFSTKAILNRELFTKVDSDYKTIIGYFIVTGEKVC